MSFYTGCLVFGIVFSVISIFFDDFISGILDVFDLDGGGTFSTIVSGLAVLGGAGLIMTSSTSWDGVFIFLASLLIAVLFSMFFYFLYIKPMRNAESSVGFSIQELVGKEGEIILAIPAKGYGEVLLNIGAAGNTGQIAASDAGEIAQGTRVVVSAIRDNVLYVHPAPKKGVFTPDNNDPDDMSAPLLACKDAINDYLWEKKSTPYFQKKLIKIAERLDTFGLRCDNIRGVIVERFSADGLSYSKFIAPVAALQEYLVERVNGFLGKMRLFHEEEYSRRIGELTEENRHETAQDYQELEQEYKDYAEKTLTILDEAILKMDKLTLELAKLGDADIDKAIGIMHDLDTVIKDVELYK